MHGNPVEKSSTSNISQSNAQVENVTQHIRQAHKIDVEKAQEKPYVGNSEERKRERENIIANKFKAETQESKTLHSEMLFINISIQDIFIYSLFTFQKLRSPSRVTAIVQWVWASCRSVSFR